MSEPAEPIPQNPASATPSRGPSADAPAAEHQRVLAESAFPGDDGRADPGLRAALAAVGATSEAYLEAVARLCGGRLLVPVVATATRMATVPGTDGRLVSDKEAEMAVVLLRAADGRQALLAFTGEDSMAAWDAAARPVPVTLDLAARAAVDDGAAALLVDVAGPAPLALDGPVLAQLAEGHRLVRLADGGFGWLRPAPAEGAEGADRS